MDWWSQPSDPRWWGTLVASFALSAFVTWLSILYARRQNLVDLPGQRRSHASPTPRGGGIGIVISALVLFCGQLLLAQQVSVRALGVAVAVALALVSIVGWIDDHRPLSARLRIVVHFVAALVLIAVPMAGDILSLPPQFAHPMRLNLFDSLFSFSAVVAIVGVLCLIVVWSINLHNFMDGINGILAWQAIFVFAMLGALTSSRSQQLSTWLLAAATLGFLPFNFPHARIFMGDVGSGALGLLIVVAAGMTLNTTRPLLAPALIAVSAFATDSTCTLLSRVLRGRRWYSPHREHLYQWMTRTGMSHVRVVVWYGLWNLLVALPVLLWIANGSRLLGSPTEALRSLDDGTENALAVAAAIYLLAFALWIFGKRWCLQKVKNSKRHASA